MSPPSDTRKPFTWVLFGIAACCLLWELAHLTAWLRVITSDASTFYLQWYDDLLQMGRFHGVSGAYANYTPPTLYFFSLISLLDGVFRPVVLLKLINIPFVVASAFVAYGIAMELNADRMRAAAVGSVVLLLPEVWQNAFHWGQYDSIYTTFLLATLYGLLRRKPGLAMICFGSALAFKLQSVFLGPTLLALLLTAELPVYWLTLVPVAYLVWMLPAALAGRGWHDLLSIYQQQSGLFTQLSVDAPNVYFLFQDSIPDGAPLERACRIANVLALGAAAWVVWRYVRSHRAASRLHAAEDVTTLTAFSLLVVPYLLPHMHERYYFPANVFAALLLASRPGALLAVVLLQAGTLATYHQYFLKDAQHLTVADFIFPVTTVTAGLLMMAWFFLQRTSVPSESNTGASPLQAHV